MKLMGTWDEPAVCALTLLATACHRHRERRLPLISEHQAARVPGANLVISPNRPFASRSASFIGHAVRALGAFYKTHQGIDVRRARCIGFRPLPDRGCGRPPSPSAATWHGQQATRQMIIGRGLPRPGTRVVQ